MKRLLQTMLVGKTIVPLATGMPASVSGVGLRRDAITKNPSAAQTDLKVVEP
ncbi:MAG: hypothetical protein AAF660_06145 [Pseudomonadota bacterium]